MEFNENRRSQSLSGARGNADPETAENYSACYLRRYLDLMQTADPDPYRGRREFICLLCEPVPDLL